MSRIREQTQWSFFLKQVTEDGTEHTFRVDDVQPLGLTALQTVLHGRREQHPTVAWGRACDAQGQPHGERVRKNFDIEFKVEVPFYGLVPGGALPPTYLLSRPTLMLDRNIVSALREPPESKRLRASGMAWVFELLNKPGTTVHPLLPSFEGSQGRLPSFEEFQEDVAATAAAVEARLPRASVTRFGEDGLRQMHAFRAQFEPRAERESRFLQRVVPLLRDTPGPSHLAELESEVLALAEAERLRPTFAVLAALAVLYESPASDYGKFGQPARQVIKPSANYSERNAYNALADLRQLEFLACSGRFQQNVALLTEDQWMSLLWCGLAVQSALVGPESSRVELRVDSDLWPRLPDERCAPLMERLAKLDVNACD